MGDPLPLSRSSSSFPIPKEFINSYAIPVAGVSLLSRSTVPDPRQLFWRWLASPAGTSSPKGAGRLQTAPSVQCDGKRAAEAEGTPDSARSELAQAMEAISLRFCSLQKRVLGEGPQPPRWPG